MKPENPPLTMTGAIIIAGALIAVAIIWTQRTTPSTSTASAEEAAQAGLPQISMAPVSDMDHILGNPKAPIKLVEYADPSCPYCQAFNPTMEQIMDEYGPSGEVAWVYRQFPLDKPDENGNVLHPNAGTQAQALECAAGLGGNTTFWTYEKDWFDTFPQGGADEPATVDDQQIAETAKSVGLDPVTFNDCLTSGRYKSRVDAEYADGINAGIDGTPYLVIITPTGTKIPLAGAQSYSTLKISIDALLNGTVPTENSDSSTDDPSTDQNVPDSSSLGQ